MPKVAMYLHLISATKPRTSVTKMLPAVEGMGGDGMFTLSGGHSPSFDICIQHRTRQNHRFSTFHNASSQSPRSSKITNSRWRPPTW